MLYFLFRYMVAGIVGAFIQVTVDFIFVEFFKRHYMEGVIVGFVCALVVVFTLQKYWTFRDKESARIKRQFILYTGISIWSLIANIFFMYILVSTLHIWYVFGQIVTIVFVSGTSIIFNILVTFKLSNPKDTLVI